MGPKTFEKLWIKQLNGFNETKLFFFPEKDKTTIKYIDGNRLLGVEMYQAQFEIDRWIGHFQHYLDTGVFDDHAYWKEYNSVKNADGQLDNVFRSNTPTAIPMLLEKKLWNVHSPALNKYMKDQRMQHGDMGFKQVGRP